MGKREWRVLGARSCAFLFSIISSCFPPPSPPVHDSLSRKDVNVDVRLKSLLVVVAGRRAVEGKLCGGVKADASEWTIDEGHVELYLEKLYPGWWPGLIEGETLVEKGPEPARPSPPAAAEADEGGGAGDEHVHPSGSDDAKRAQAGDTTKTARKRPLSARGCRVRPKPGQRRIGTKGHGKVNELGNESENISMILQQEARCQQMYDTLRESVGDESDATLAAAFELMEQWIGNYRLTLIDKLLNGERNLLEICRQKGGHWYLKGIQMLAFCRWKQFRFREALTLFYEFQERAGKSAVLLENIGHTHNSLGEPEKAEQCFVEALQRIQRGESGNKGGLLLGLGIVKKARGDLVGSAEILDRALRHYQGLYKGVEHSLVAKSHTSVGRTFSEMLEHEKAEHHFYEAVRIFWLTCGKSPLTANAAKKLADIKCDLKRYDDAQQLYRQALELHVGFDTLDLRAILDILNTVPSLHTNPTRRAMLSRPGLDQYMAAIRTLKTRVDALGPLDGTGAVTYKSAAELAFAAGARDTAAELFVSALKFFRVTKEADCTRLIADCERMLAVARAPKGKPRTGQKTKPRGKKR